MLQAPSDPLKARIFLLIFPLLLFNVSCSLFNHSSHENIHASNCSCFLSSCVFMPPLSPEDFRGFWWQSDSCLSCCLFSLYRGKLSESGGLLALKGFYHTNDVCGLCVGGCMCMCWSEFVLDEALSSKQPQTADLGDTVCNRWISSGFRRDEE